MLAHVPISQELSLLSVHLSMFRVSAEKGVIIEQNQELVAFLYPTISLEYDEPNSS